MSATFLLPMTHTVIGYAALNINIKALHICSNRLEITPDSPILASMEHNISYVYREQILHLGPLLLKWFNFNPIMDK